MTFADFITDHGTKAVADRLGVVQGRVRLWKHRGAIPRELWGDLLVAFPALKVDDLFKMELSRQPDQ